MNESLLQFLYLLNAIHHNPPHSILLSAYNLDFKTSGCFCISVDTVDHSLDSHPNRKIIKDLDDTALIRKGCFLKDRHIGQHTILDDVLDNLVDKINLSAVQLRFTSASIDRF